MTRRIMRLGAIAVLAAACGGGGAASPSSPEEPGPSPAEPAPPAPPVTPPSSPAPSSVTISTPDRTFSPAAARIAAGGTVTWQAVERDHEIVFTGAAPAGGSPGEVEEGTSVSRTFDEPGTYEYHCARHVDKGMQGTIVVVADSAGGGGGGGGGSAAATVSTPGSSFSPATVTIAAGGTVTWNISGARHNVTFRGSAPAGGSIPDTDGASVSRTFALPGDYPYDCTRHSGMSGRVVVR